MLPNEAAAITGVNACGSSSLMGAAVRPGPLRNGALWVIGRIEQQPLQVVVSES
jgi:hypothetical protein